MKIHFHACGLARARDMKDSEIAGTGDGGFCNGRTDKPLSEHIRLDLHQQVVGRRVDRIWNLRILLNLTKMQIQQRSVSLAASEFAAKGGARPLTPWSPTSWTSPLLIRCVTTCSLSAF